MDRILITMARDEAWPWDAPHHPEALFSGDHLIALAGDCKRQWRQPSAPLTEEDATILMRRLPDAILRPDYVYLSAHRRYLIYLNA